MEQIMWYFLASYILSLIIISGFFGNRVNGLDKDLEKQKEYFEKKNTELSIYFNKELLKLKFEFNNKPKYAVGDTINDFIILFVNVEEQVSVIGYDRECYTYYNRYEVLNTVEKTKHFYSENDLLKKVGAK